MKYLNPIKWLKDVIEYRFVKKVARVYYGLSLSTNRVEVGDIRRALRVKDCDKWKFNLKIFRNKHILITPGVFANSPICQGVIDPKRKFNPADYDVKTEEPEKIAFAVISGPFATFEYIIRPAVKSIEPFYLVSYFNPATGKSVYSLEPYRNLKRR